MHRAIAAALATAPDASAAQLAHHWHRAGQYADALRASIAAGLEASRVYAFAEAGGHLDRAIELWEGVAAADGSLLVDRVELLARAAQAARFAGDSRRAIALVKFFDLQVLRRARRRRDRDPGRECGRASVSGRLPPV